MMMRGLIMVLICMVAGAHIATATPISPILPTTHQAPRMQETAPSSGVALPSSSGTPISEAQANTFYKKCSSDGNSLQRFSPVQKELFCSCIAVNMQKNLTVEDVQALNTPQTPPGQAAMLKMLEKVHFPCALQPIEDSVRQECITRASANPQFAAGGQQYCGCLANKMMNYVRKVGVPQALYQLSSTGQVGEPMDALTNSSGYTNELISSYYSCFNGVLP